jgi:hypothetical protein
MTKIMTERENSNINNSKCKMSKTLATYMIAMAGLIALAASPGQQNISAQMMGAHGNFENMTSGLRDDKQEMTINGTINLEQTVFEAIGAKVNTSLTQAITAAEQAVGNNSFALAAFGADQGGFLGYTIILGTPGMEFYYVIVDPGNGQILTTQKASQKEIEEKHLAHSKALVESGGSGAGGFGLRALQH